MSSARTGSPAAVYERFAYPGRAHPATHPSRLEVIGRLFGLRPAPASRCRVLELGCGDGGNALSIAQSLPGARVVGIDAAAGAISRGCELARAAGLDNVELRVGELERLPDDLGDFDYVVAHGVYSWIAPSARGALLDCCAGNLVPDGVAFVSYNAYPGSYLRDMARDILRYHVRDAHDPETRLAQAHHLMATIVAVDAPTPYARVLHEHMERMLRAPDALLFHDDLAEISTPFYFHEFIEHAAGHGLSFLSEADLFESQLRDVPESVGQLMSRLPDDVLVREQYLDFFKNRMFRQTLLCHADAGVRGELDSRPIERFAIASSAGLDHEIDAGTGEEGDGAETFVTPDGCSMTTSEPHVRAVMHALSEAWPAAIDFASLLGRAGEAAGPGAPTELVKTSLTEVLLQAYLARVVALHGCAPPVSGSPEARPLASPLARAQCAAGSAVVSSLLHVNVGLESGLDSELLPLLDGTRTRGRSDRGVVAPRTEGGSGTATLRLRRAAAGHVAGRHPGGASPSKCAREDSNLHGPNGPQGPQPCASTSSATGARTASIALPRGRAGRPIRA